MALNPDLSPFGAVPMAGEGEGMGGAGVVPKKMESKEGKEAQRAESEKTDKGEEQPEVTNGWPFQGRASFSGMPSSTDPLNNPHSRSLQERRATDHMVRGIDNSIIFQSGHNKPRFPGRLGKSIVEEKMGEKLVGDEPKHDNSLKLLSSRFSVAAMGDNTKPGSPARPPRQIFR